MTINKSPIFNRAIILYCSIFFTLISCGIDTIVYLSERVTSDAISYTFTPPESSDSNYSGISIFYRIYASESDAIADKDSLDSRQNADNVIPGNYISSYLLSQSYLKYQQIYLSGVSSEYPSLSKTLIPNSNYLVSINFPASSSIKPSITIKNKTTLVELSYNLFRRVTDSSENHLEFSKIPISTDTDFKTNTSNTGSYFVQFFACSYGIDYSTLNDLYGNAVYLGIVELPETYFIN